MIVLLVTLGLVLLVSVVAEAATVSANPANLAAVLRSVEPGDTVLLADGVYRGDLLLTNSGTPDAPITIKAEGKRATVDGGEVGLLTEGASGGVARFGLIPYGIGDCGRGCWRADRRLLEGVGGEPTYATIVLYELVQESCGHSWFAGRIVIGCQEVVEVDIGQSGVYLRIDVGR